MLRRLSLCAAMLIGPPAAQAQSASIPPIHTESLAGTPVNLPDDLHGRTAILVLGFTRGSQDEVAAWSKRLAATYRDSTTVQYYELALLASVPRPMRGFVTHAMKRSVPDRAQPRFLPLTTDESTWRTLAHYQGGDSASLLIISPTGKLLWQTQGPSTDAVFDELQHHLP